MPTVRVHCPSEQVKVWSVCVEVTVSHRVEGCFVTVACGLVDIIDLAKAQLTLVAVVCGLVCAGVAVLHRGEGCLVTQRGAPRGVFNCLCIRRFV